MTDDLNLLSTFAGVLQSFSFLLLLLGVYLWTLKPLLIANGTDDEDRGSD